MDKVNAPRDKVWLRGAMMHVEPIYAFQQLALRDERELYD